MVWFLDQTSLKLWCAVLGKIHFTILYLFTEFHSHMNETEAGACVQRARQMGKEGFKYLPEAGSSTDNKGTFCHLVEEHLIVLHVCICANKQKKRTKLPWTRHLCGRRGPGTSCPKNGVDIILKHVIHPNPENITYTHKKNHNAWICVCMNTIPFFSSLSMQKCWRTSLLPLHPLM